jgi:hypothetical protein
MYAKQKLYEETISLVGDKAIDRRLMGAASHLQQLDPSHLSELSDKDRRDLASVLHTLTGGDEGSIEASVRRLTTDEAAKVAHDILEICNSPGRRPLTAA